MWVDLKSSEFLLKHVAEDECVTFIWDFEKRRHVSTKIPWGQKKTFPQP